MLNMTMKPGKGCLPPCLVLDTLFSLIVRFQIDVVCAWSFDDCCFEWRHSATAPDFEGQKAITPACLEDNTIVGTTAGDVFINFGGVLLCCLHIYKIGCGNTARHAQPCPEGGVPMTSCTMMP